MLLRGESEGMVSCVAIEITTSLYSASALYPRPVANVENSESSLSVEVQAVLIYTSRGPVPSTLQW